MSIGTDTSRKHAIHPHGGSNGSSALIRHYRAYPPVALPDRRWPDRTIERAPIWCSVDLRDGNQALIEPMGPDRKRAMFDRLVAIGFREIEVGFPSASTTEMAFMRSLVDDSAIPESVTVQVLTQARADLIRPTMDSIRGVRRAIVHLYNSTSALQRRVVFERDRAGVIDIARRAAEQIRELALRADDTEVVFEYSPESFTGTELDFAIEIVEAVMEIWEPTRATPMIVNLPATVEMASPNVYADQIEFFDRHIAHRDRLVLSVHPHNDRGTAVAAAELALMAGADRVEGTLFGNGERTGNVDLVTLALNLLTQGVDPRLDLRDINGLVRLVEDCNQLPVHPRHPYAGELVFTAFSGSHQDAIKKGLAALAESGSEVWEVPYLPMDPAHVGRSYDELIRVNSQSGKGGVAFVLERDHGVKPPRRMQIEFQRVVQGVAEATGSEVGSKEIAALFESEYLAASGPLRLVDKRWQVESLPDGRWRVRAGVDRVDEGDVERVEVEAIGNGPIDAFFSAISKSFAPGLRLTDYREHALAAGSDADAIAYVEVIDAAGVSWHGAGRDASSVLASLRAVLSGVNRALRRPGDRTVLS
jgi:2-isopropylmalate synthase